MMWTSQNWTQLQKTMFSTRDADVDENHASTYTEESSDGRTSMSSICFSGSSCHGLFKETASLSKPPPSSGRLEDCLYLALNCVHTSSTSYIYSMTTWELVEILISHKDTCWNTRLDILSIYHHTAFPGWHFSRQLPGRGHIYSFQ